MSPPTLLAGKRALVLGRDPSGEAAAALLRRLGVDVVLRDAAVTSGPSGPHPDLVVVSLACTSTPPLARALAAQGAVVLGERELAFQHSLCLHVAVTGNCGKTTTTDLVAHLLSAAGRRVAVACGPDRPACALVDSTRDMDLLVHGVAPPELEHFHYFRPVVGVLLNLPARPPEAGEEWDACVRRFSRLFARQQAFDWAIIQSAALAQLRTVADAPPGKRITFSATDPQADLGLDRGLLVSRLEGWAGPLWDTARGSMTGPHLAEDVLAALAVGRVLRVGLDDMTTALGDYRPPPGRMELLGAVGGVRFVHDGCAAQLDALAKALVALAPTPPERPFIWLIAGGRGAGRQFYDLGPVLSPRVKHAFVFGDAAPAMRAAWQLFTPCTTVVSLLDAASRAVEQAASGEVILFSPACPDAGAPSRPTPGADVFREVFEGRLRRASGKPAVEGGKSGAGSSDGTATPARNPPPPTTIS